MLLPTEEVSGPSFLCCVDFEKVTHASVLSHLDYCNSLHSYTLLHWSSNILLDTFRAVRGLSAVSGPQAGQSGLK